MQIKKTVIDGANNAEITIAATVDGATIAVRYPGAGMIEGCTIEFARNDEPERRWEIATTVAGFVYGVTRRGGVCATNSMVHELKTEIERVAVC